MQLPVLPDEIWCQMFMMTLHMGPRRQLIHHRPYYSQVGCKRKIGTFYFSLKYKPLMSETEIARVYYSDWSKWLREVAAML